MSRLPEKGEAEAAADMLRDRMEAISDGDPARHYVVAVNTRTDAMCGEHAPVRSLYGDLFIVGEMAEASQAPVLAFINDIAMGTDPVIALRSMYLLAVAHGCLMERARWEKRDAA